MHTSNSLSLQQRVVLSSFTWSTQSNVLLIWICKQEQLQSSNKSRYFWMLPCLCLGPFCCWMFCWLCICYGNKLFTKNVNVTGQNFIWPENVLHLLHKRVKFMCFKEEYVNKTQAGLDNNFQSILLIKKQTRYKTWKCLKISKCVKTFCGRCTDKPPHKIPHYEFEERNI